VRIPLFNALASSNSLPLLGNNSLPLLGNPFRALQGVVLVSRQPLSLFFSLASGGLSE
jgi:hypothetical protein